jgi:hypothetical protein
LQGSSLSADTEMATETGTAAPPSGLRGRTGAAGQSGGFRHGKSEAMPLSVSDFPSSVGPQTPLPAAAVREPFITLGAGDDGADCDAFPSAMYSPMSTIAPPGPPSGLAPSGTKRSRDLPQDLSSGMDQDLNGVSSPPALELDALLNDGTS